MNDSVISSCFEASLQGQAIVSETGAFLLVNTAFCQHFGYSKEEMYERPIESFFICEDHATKENHSDFLFKKGQKYEQVEKVILHGNGYLQSTLFTITDVSSSEETCFHLQLDRVTVNLQQDGDQKMLLESIRNRDEVRLPKKILDGIKDAIITIKLNGQFLYVNEEAEKMLALTWNDLQQSDFWSYLMKDRNETLTKKFYHLLVGEDYAQVEYFDKKHSKWFDVRAYRSEDQVTMYFINVTERKQMEEELRLKEENYRSLVENIPETITVHDGNEFIYINPAGESLFGVTNADRLSETKLNQLLSTYDMAKVREGIRQLLSGDIAVDHSLYTLLLQNGKTIESKQRQL
ncbi:two-component hybrid sensor and regulator [Halalkalibacter wakoensis JCM 9140]|uniref:Two-component hybrid sensor and regulator n=1 Tax=Halalkalibacter wakoensis JCM 9140 TaxID=1236970 RepID=W4PZ78_9BACI|nr:PAS domain S-box protein [Halalkalibacter wakoensis]GAE24798.1 two-component hybrid sensor and regulator [Halalkalibacter wakoensis JCM 9140]